LALARITVVALGVCLVLAATIHFEAAAFAYRNGIKDLNSGSETGVTYLEQAAALNGVEPTYDFALASTYSSLARNRYTGPSPVILSGSHAFSSQSADDIVRLNRQQLLQLALQAGLAAHDLSPLDPAGSAQLGHIYLQLNRVPDAIQAFQQAHRLSPSAPKYYDDEARALLQGHQYQAAFALVNRATELDDGYWFTRYVSALVADRQGDRATAQAEASTALGLARAAYPPPDPAIMQTLRRLAKSG